MQAIARTNRLHEGKDYGLIVDYRGLIEKLDTAMDMYSGAGLENFDGGDLKGVVVDVMSAIGNLRSAYTQLVELFAPVGSISDAEAVEVFLADDKMRQDFYTLLCAFGRALHLVLNAEQATTRWARRNGEVSGHVHLLFKGSPQRQAPVLRRHRQRRV